MSLCVLLNQSFIAQIQHPIIQIIENPIAKKASNQFIYSASPINTIPLIV